MDALNFGEPENSREAQGTLADILSRLPEGMRNTLLPYFEPDGPIYHPERGVEGPDSIFRLPLETDYTVPDLSTEEKELLSAAEEWAQNGMIREYAEVAKHNDFCQEIVGIIQYVLNSRMKQRESLLTDPERHAFIEQQLRKNGLSNTDNGNPIYKRIVAESYELTNLSYNHPDPGQFDELSERLELLVARYFGYLSANDVDTAAIIDHIKSLNSLADQPYSHHLIHLVWSGAKWFLKSLKDERGNPHIVWENSTIKWLMDYLCEIGDQGEYVSINQNTDEIINQALSRKFSSNVSIKSKEDELPYIYVTLKLCADYARVARGKAELKEYYKENDSRRLANTAYDPRKIKSLVEIQKDSTSPLFIIQTFNDTPIPSEVVRYSEDLEWEGLEIEVVEPSGNNADGKLNCESWVAPEMMCGESYYFIFLPEYVEICELEVKDTSGNVLKINRDFEIEWQRDMGVYRLKILNSDYFRENIAYTAKYRFLEETDKVNPADFMVSSSLLDEFIDTLESYGYNNFASEFEKLQNTADRVSLASILSTVGRHITYATKSGRRDFDPANWDDTLWYLGEPNKRGRFEVQCTQASNLMLHILEGLFEGEESYLSVRKTVVSGTDGRYGVGHVYNQILFRDENGKLKIVEFDATPEVDFKNLISMEESSALALLEIFRVNMPEQNIEEMLHKIANGKLNWDRIKVEEQIDTLVYLLRDANLVYEDCLWVNARIKDLIMMIENYDQKNWNNSRVVKYGENLKKYYRILKGLSTAAQSMLLRYEL